jgi:hypothetical protein
MNIYNLPIKTFHKCIEDNSLEPLYASKKGLLRKVLKGCSEVIFDRIQCQLIDEFGLGRDAEMIFYKKNTILRNKIKEILTGENHETANLILQREIENIQARLKKSNIKNLRQNHSRMYRTLDERYKRNSKELSVFEFYTDVNDLQKENEQKRSETKKPKLRKVG